MAIEGRLDRIRLPEVLQVISQQRKTGILTVQGREDIIAVSFAQGRIVAADALNETASAGVGSLLVEQGKLTSAALQGLVARAEAEGRRLIDLVVDEGELTRSSLLETLREQTCRLMVSLLAWDAGEFKFYGGDEVSYEEGFRSIGVDELLLFAIEQQEPAQARSVPKVDTRMRRIEGDRKVALRNPQSLDSPSALSGGADGLDDGSMIWVTPDEKQILDAVDGERTVHEIADQAGVTDDRARLVLYRLSREGVVTPTSGTGAIRAAVLSGMTGSSAFAGPDGVGEAPAPLGASGPAASPAVPPDGGSGPGPTALDEGSAERLESESAAATPPTEGVVATGVPGARWLAAGLAVAAAVLLVLTVIRAPVSFLLPFPWLDEERAALHDERDGVHRLELDRAAKTFFLLHGRFPDDLGELTGTGLIDAGDLVDSRGRPLRLETAERSYTLRSYGEETEPYREGIAGNFLLDPEVVARTTAEEQEAPLILLD